MTTAAEEPLRWSRGRWCGFLALVFGAQLGFIFWLGRPAPVRPRRAFPVPTLRLAGAASSDWLALSDQTLFALPHLQSFSGQAWLRIPPSPFRRSEWSEPAKWLPLPVRDLGEDFDRFIATNSPMVAPNPARADPRLTLPDVPPLTISRHQSSWRIEGALAQRRMLTTLDLPSWAHTDLLTNTVVQLLVDADGRPVSVTRLGSGAGSGLPAADQFALDRARAMRFEPRGPVGPGRVANPLSQLTWGTMIFEWHTLPPAATNAPGANPQQ